MKKILSLFALSILLFTGCKKTDSVNNNSDSQTVLSSITGKVVDENKNPVVGANVKVGSKSAITDNDGYFSITGISSSSENQIVTAEYAGYFKSIKTYNAKKLASANFTFQLLPKDVDPQIVSSNTGGLAVFSDNVEVELQANSVVYASTNSPYNGDVTVSEIYLDPTSPDINYIMPGKLLGTSSSGDFVGLKSFGMIAVELTASDGSLLQIAQGKTAQITIPIPASLTATALNTIPLWYFDENTGLWKEQGSATKQGTNYVGNVSHFTYWNCDQSTCVVDFDFNIKDSDSDSAIGNAKVTITFDSTYTIEGFTDDNGDFLEKVPCDKALSVRVEGECGAIYTTSVPRGYTHLGYIRVRYYSTLPTVPLHGRILDCNNLPVSGANVYVQIPNSGIFRNLTTDTAGNYSTVVVNCLGNTAHVTIFAGNPRNGTNSGFLSFNQSGNDFSIPDITLPCQSGGGGGNEFFTYDITGVGTRTYSTPTDRVFMVGDTLGVITLFAQSLSDSSYVEFQFSSTGISQGSLQRFNAVFMSPNSDGGYSSGSGQDSVTITEYGNIGGYIAGNINATLVGITSQIPRQVSMSFRMIRR